MMLLPAGIRMNDLLALAEEMDPLGSPEREGKHERRGLTSDSTMQLASYLATKVTLAEEQFMTTHRGTDAENCYPQDR